MIALKTKIPIITEAENSTKIENKELLAFQNKIADRIVRIAELNRQVMDRVRVLEDQPQKVNLSLGNSIKSIVARTNDQFARVDERLAEVE